MLNYKIKSVNKFICIRNIPFILLSYLLPCTYLMLPKDVLTFILFFFCYKLCHFYFLPNNKILKELTCLWRNENALVLVVDAIAFFYENKYGINSK